MKGRTFHNGARVRVHTYDPPGHNRTPRYVRGRDGIIIAHTGSFPNPEERAYHRSGLPALHLYRVRFAQTDLWPNYCGGQTDSVVVDIFEHWLQATEATR